MRKSRCPVGQRVQQEVRLELEIISAHKRKTCGPERLQRDLSAYGVEIGILINAWDWDMKQNASNTIHR